MKPAHALAAISAAALFTVPAAMAVNPPPQRFVDLQLLSFNDYHGHLEATDGPLAVNLDPAKTAVGGAEYLASTLTALRTTVPNDESLTVAAGDLIGGSTFLSGLFHDEPSVETLDAMGLDVSSVGNHEFDEGTAELLRMQYGGCHPKDGCYFPSAPYAGAHFRWLAANVVRKDTGMPLLPATEVRVVKGVRVGFIGMTLKATPTLVNPAGVSTVDFLDEVETANAQARALQKRGVQAIVVLVHEGGYQTGTYNQCVGLSEPIAGIAARLSPAIDAVVTGHTHQPYVCNIPDPAGNPRMVTSAADFGRVVTETHLVLDRATQDVARTRVTSTNHLVTRTFADPVQTAILAKWKAISDPVAGRVVGTITQDVVGDATNTSRAIETPMVDLVADAILWGTSGASGGAQIAFMNIGGVRASLRAATITNGEQPGQITYAEAYAIAPFSNLLVTMDLTGAQIKTILEQQYQPVPARGSRPMLALGVSSGFSYAWDATQPQGSRVVPGSMTLNGVPIDMAATYRVGTLNFLAAGGDLFTEFTNGRNLLGGSEDLANLVAYFEAHPGVTPPADRISGM